jgi:hypothetical protein
VMPIASICSTPAGCGLAGWRASAAGCCQG